MADVFNELNAVNVNGHTEERNGLTYLSWAWAWAEVKKRYPDARYSIWRDERNLPYVYDPMTGYMVYTTVQIGNITHEMWLPVMDSANNAMKAEPYTYTVKNSSFKWAKKAQDGRYYDKYGNEQKEFIEKHVDAATMFDINKTIMRCLTKNLAMFGLGLYIYAGTDLPEVVEESRAEQNDAVSKKNGAKKASVVMADKNTAGVVVEPQKDDFDRRRQEFLNTIMAMFADKDRRNGVYKMVLEKMGLENPGKLSADQLEQAKRYVVEAAQSNAG